MSETGLKDIAAIVARCDATRLLSPDQMKAMAGAVLASLEDGGSEEDAARAMLAFDETFMIPMAQAMITVSAIRRHLANAPQPPSTKVI